MRWPWRRAARSDQVVVSWSDGVLAFVRARATGPSQFQVVSHGVEREASSGRDALVHRLQEQGLKGAVVHAMLRPQQYQLLQIDTPPVKPEELRAAARFQIRDLVNAHIDDMTLDVMQVGDGQHKSGNHLFVVAARNEVIREVLDLGDALSWQVPVIDVQDMAQRNLQALAARDADRLARAEALLLISDAEHALLTITANEELFFSRRIDLPPGFLETRWDELLQAHAAAPVNAFTPVAEYVPEYAGGGDYVPGGVHVASDTDRLQRLVVEVQRSLDLWDRTWTSLPLAGLSLHAPGHSGAMAEWLARELGQTVGTLALGNHFVGLDAVSPEDLAYCLPLLGVLLRDETRKL